MNIFYTYILKSKLHNKHYFGYTANLDKRLSEHNLGLSSFTKKYLPLELIYFEEFPSCSDAIKCEKFFKYLIGYHWLKNNGIV